VHGGVVYHTEVLWVCWAGLLKLVYDLQFNYFLEDTQSENEATIILFEILFDTDVANTQAAFRTASDRFALGYGRYRFIQSQKYLLVSFHCLVTKHGE
jgi:hypothetical protein